MTPETKPQHLVAIRHHDSRKVLAADEGKVPVSVFVKDELACLIMADEFAPLNEIARAYAEWTGFDPRVVKCGVYGLNILTAELR